MFFAFVCGCMYTHSPKQHTQRWITYQLLLALQQSHSADVCHGDIKTENILVTSWNWLYLTDFASYKPLALPIDNPVHCVVLGGGVWCVCGVVCGCIVQQGTCGVGVGMYAGVYYNTVQCKCTTSIHVQPLYIAMYSRYTWTMVYIYFNQYIYCNQYIHYNHIQ